MTVFCQRHQGQAKRLWSREINEIGVDFAQAYGIEKKRTIVELLAELSSRYSNLRRSGESVNIAAPVTKIEIMEIMEEIKSQIDSNPILLYMKGSPDQPQCGFSSQASQVLMACGEKFAFIDILANPEIRANLPQLSEWPTFPQLFIGGELVGGCDIINEMYQSGELEPMIKDAAPVEE